MNLFTVKSQLIRGTNYKEIHKKALRFYSELLLNTKRKPYIRSAYFDNQKIFLNLFWSHLYEKANRRDRSRRLQLLPCAIEVLKISKIQPLFRLIPNVQGVKLYRFYGQLTNGLQFCAQVKESGQEKSKKHFISVFPIEQGKRLR